MSHGVVTSWEHPEGRRCAYVRMAGRWYSTRIVPALDGFATLHAIRDSNRRKTPIMFSVLPPITECGPLPGIRDLDSPFVASPAAVIQTLAWGRHRHRSGGYLMPGTPLAHPRAS